MIQNAAMKMPRPKAVLDRIIMNIMHLLHQYSLGVLQNRRDVFSWKCEVPGANGKNEYLGVDMTGACRMRFGDTFIAKYYVSYDSYGWYCQD